MASEVFKITSQVAKRAARLSKASKVTLPSRKSMISLYKLARATGAAKISPMVGMTALAGATALGVKAINKAGKKAKDAWDNVSKISSESSARNAKMMKEQLVKRKAETGMSYSERQAKKEKDEYDRIKKKIDSYNENNKRRQLSNSQPLTESEATSNFKNMVTSLTKKDYNKAERQYLKRYKK